MNMIVNSPTLFIQTQLENAQPKPAEFAATESRYAVSFYGLGHLGLMRFFQRVKTYYRNRQQYRRLQQ